MNMQRLKFAFARGARIQARHDWCGSRRWSRCDHPSWAECNSYRIHPDDAHLEYGPLSSALRTDVINGVWGSAGWAAVYMLDEILQYHEHKLLSESKREDVHMFYLMAAESLADRGI